MNILLDLFLTFAKIGLFTFGGGYAMIAMIENSCVEHKQWINCATFTGYKKAGFPGALTATLGIITPSFIVIYLISMFLDHFLEMTMIANAFKGIKIAVGILILDAAATMIKKMQKKKLPRTLMVCSCMIMLCVNLFAWNFSSISLMLIAGIVSLTIFMLRGSPVRKGGEEK